MSSEFSVSFRLGVCLVRLVGLVPTMGYSVPVRVRLNVHAGTPHRVLDDFPEDFCDRNSGVKI
jgi:hypothetical protein